MNYSLTLCEGLKMCVSVNKNLCGKLISLWESPITFDKRLKNIPIPFLFQIESLNTKESFLTSS